MQLLVKGTRRIIFILCAVSDAKRYYSSPSKVVEGGVYCQISLMW